MLSRSFLSGAVALVMGRVGIVRDKVDPRPHPLPSVPPAPDEATVRRDHAMARLILRRVGITPLAALLVVILITMTPGMASAEPGQVRTTALATARATILPSSARVEQGRIILTGTNPQNAHPAVQSTIRACDLAPASQPAAPPICRMIVYDLP